MNSIKPTINLASLTTIIITSKTNMTIQINSTNNTIITTINLTSNNKSEVNTNMCINKDFKLLTLNSYHGRCLF